MFPTDNNVNIPTNYQQPRLHNAVFVHHFYFSKLFFVLVQYLLIFDTFFYYT